MDAVEFLKQWKRMCNEDNCMKCPFDDEKEGCSFHTDSEEEVIRKVDEWSKQHPKIELTEQQITAIKGRIAEGAKWIFKECGVDDYVFFADKKPKKTEYYFIVKEWKYYKNGDGKFYDFVTFKNSPIYLPSLLEDE